MKSIETPSNGPKGIGKGLYNPNFFLCTNLVLWHFARLDIMFYVFLDFKPVESLPQQLSCHFLSMVSYQGHILHDFCAQLSF